jgi:DNA-binding MarR family transcriptional regulator
MSPSENLQTSLRTWMHLFKRRSMHDFLHTMRDSGLSRSQFGTLFQLHRHGACPIFEIGEELGITAPAASQMVDRLVNLDLIERSEDPQDRRVKQISLTDAGTELVQKGYKARGNWINELIEQLSDEEKLITQQGIEILIEKTIQLEEENKEHSESWHAEIREERV